MREPSEEHPSMESATTFFQDMLYYVQVGQPFQEKTENRNEGGVLAARRNLKYRQPIGMKGKYSGIYIYLHKYIRMELYA